MLVLRKRTADVHAQIQSNDEMSAREQELENNIEYLKGELDQAFDRIRALEDVIGLSDDACVEEVDRYMERQH